MKSNSSHVPIFRIIFFLGIQVQATVNTRNSCYVNQNKKGIFKKVCVTKKSARSLQNKCYCESTTKISKGTFRKHFRTVMYILSGKTNFFLRLRLV